MDDNKIIELYWQRDESAIAETTKKYGRFCYSIAANILSNSADAQECVNDVYLSAWNSIPPQRPDNFRAWLGKVVRNTALNIWNKNHAQKRYSDMEQFLAELDECVPSTGSTDDRLEENDLTEFLDGWLGSLARTDRILFVRRYWYGDSVKSLAGKCGMSANKTAKRLYIIRQSLKTALEKEGYII